MAQPVALITGASRGIGRVIAEGLAEDGFALALVARSAEALAEVAQTIAQRHGADLPVLTFALDVRQPAAVADAVATVCAQLGRVDLLINNAGVGQAGSLDLASEAFDQMLDINLRGAFHLLQAVVPVMKQQGSGTIINVASRAGKVGVAGYAAYSASKFGLVGLSEALYRELTPLGIKVTALCPSRVDTELSRSMGLGSDAMVPSADMLSAVRWLLSLSPSACVRELMIECKGYLS